MAGAANFVFFGGEMQQAPRDLCRASDSSVHQCFFFFFFFGVSLIEVCRRAVSSSELRRLRTAR